MDIQDRITIFFLTLWDGLMDWITLRTWSRLRGRQIIHYQLKGVNHE